MSDSDAAGPTVESETLPGPSWIPAALLILLASVVGLAALALFCHAYGLNLQDEGWSDRVEGTAAVNPIEMAGSVIGMIVSTVLYWVGFLRLTRIGHREPR